MNLYLETPRMLLREIHSGDEENMFDLDSDPKVMKYLTNGVPSTREFIQAALQRTEALLKKHGGRFGFWAAIQKSDGAFMGWFLFRPAKKDPENTSRIELGYRLKKKFWGQGFATEGSVALISKGFSELDVQEVFATTLLKNLGSQNVMKKAGLKFVREFVSDEYPRSDETDVEYAISRELWKRPHVPGH